MPSISAPSDDLTPRALDYYRASEPRQPGEVLEVPDPIASTAPGVDAEQFADEAMAWRSLLSPPSPPPANGPQGQEQAAPSETPPGAPQAAAEPSGPEGTGEATIAQPAPAPAALPTLSLSALAQQTFELTREADQGVQGFVQRLPANIARGTFRALDNAGRLLMGPLAPKADQLWAERFPDQAELFAEVINGLGGTGVSDAIAQDLSQFLIPFGVYMKGLNMAGYFGKASAGGQLLARSITAEQAALLTAFDPHRENIAQLALDLGVNWAFTDWLAAPSDNTAVSAFKNQLSEAGLSAAIGTAFMTAAILYKAVVRRDPELLARVREFTAPGPQGPGAQVGKIGTGRPRPSVQAATYRIDERRALNIPPRDGKLGVGKTMGTRTWVHRDYAQVLDRDGLQQAIAKLPEDFDYDIVSHDRASGQWSFIKSVDFDTSTEPTLGERVIVTGDGRVMQKAAPANPPILHHKWTVVGDDYEGFSVQQSINRSVYWSQAVPKGSKSGIGFRDQWASMQGEIDKWHGGQAATAEDFGSASGRTAIARKAPSVPVSQFAAAEMFHGKRVLHAGAGRPDNPDRALIDESSLEAVHYDPNHGPTDRGPLGGRDFDVAVSNFVLNTLPPDGRTNPIADLVTSITDDGEALVAVRSASDVNGNAIKAGWTRVHDGWQTGSGTFQKGYTPEQLVAELTPYFEEVELVKLKGAGQAVAAVGRKPIRRAFEPAGGGFADVTALEDAVQRATHLPARRLTWNGKDLREWEPEDYAEFGDAHGVSNLGPLSKVETREHQGYSYQIPGGFEGTFTFVDLLHLKANPIDPSRLPMDDRVALQRKLSATVAPDPDDDLEVFNRMVFGLLSPNQPLTPNEFEYAIMRAGSPGDIERLAGMIDWKAGEVVSKERRVAAQNQMKLFFETQSREQGGMGLKGSADYTNVAELAQLFIAKPDFFRKKPTEGWDEFAERLMSQVRGMAPKVASFSAVWQDPAGAAISAVDRHMGRNFVGKMFKDKKERRAWEAGIVTKWNEAVDRKALLEAQFDAGEVSEEQFKALRKTLPKGKAEPIENIDELFLYSSGDGWWMNALMARLGEFERKFTIRGKPNPAVPQHLHDTDWVVQPEKASIIGDAYRAALAENDRLAREHGLHLFASQWMLWDGFRRRIEPHEVMFPGLHRLPKPSRAQYEEAIAEHKRAGFFAHSKAEDEGIPDKRMRPTRPWEGGIGRGSYFSVAPMLGAGPEFFEREVANDE